jgi:predicted GNAT family acetyltransferase
MEDIQLKIDDNGSGHFFIVEGEEELGEMQVKIDGNHLTVYHTEVQPQAEGKGFAKKLFAAMVDHARKNALQIVPLCTYVLSQLKRHPDEYADVWKKHSH